MDSARKECAMRSFHARGVAAVIVLASLATTALAQDVGIPSLLPLPPAQQPAYPSYPVTQTAATDVLWSQPNESPAPTPAIDTLPSPSDVKPDDQSVISPDYENAMYGDEGGGSCDICGDGGGYTCPRFYSYGNA